MTTSVVGFVGDVDKIPWSEMAELHSYEAVSGMAVTAAAGTRNVQVATGKMWIPGILFKVTAAEVVTFGANASGNPRIDRLVARANWGTNTCVLAVVPGTPAASPSPPALTRTAGGTWEAALARVLIQNGATTINSGDITFEGTPKVGGFQRISSINTAPDPAVNAGLIYYTGGGARSLRVADGGVYREIANGRVEYAIGVTSLSLNSQGIGFITHDLGWIPDVFHVDPVLDSTGGEIRKYTATETPTVNVMPVRGYRNDTGGVWVNGNFSEVMWTAARNVP